MPRTLTELIDLEEPAWPLVQSLQRDIDEFYGPNRWPGWEPEVSAVSPDDGISVYPFLWATGDPIAERIRATVPMAELWRVHTEMARQLSELPDGAAIKIEVTDD